ncbi:hypothetical protein GCM10011519_23220 [Marmoricola endophyticus]|uniref:Helix-turn-helix domain-containing protein n=1 Tax=Marmoricola endophyticus TaxID=2040280 RepID=A0A917BL47_9ACTN|nr:helix-turn-helix domain-containing protein [Marmoricola endophyticus]GGF48542.1 hypothetical protein GCM10011519_23220 [Marmoricola endophyticus]
MSSTHDTHTETTSRQNGLHDGDQMLTLKEVATLLRVPEATLRYWRHLHTGPHSFRLGRSVRYWRTDVTTWLEEQSRG